VHCVQELVYYGQEIFELAETVGDLSDLAYIAARNHATAPARAGCAGAMASDVVDAIVAPPLPNSTGPAVAGYPNFSMPVGIRSSGRPAGMLMSSTFWHEAELIAFAYDLAQEFQARPQPQFLGSIVPVPTAGLCEGLPKKPHVFT